jgi:predicted Zn-dependent peptidase
MLFKGTQSRSSFDLALAFDRMGGYANAYTDTECVVVYCVVPACSAAEALKIMLDMIFNSRFGGEEIEIEREVIISEIISARDDAEEEAVAKTAEAVWRKNSIALGVAGKEESVTNITRTQLLHWYKKYFTDSAFSVFAAGNINTGDLEKLLADVPGGTTLMPALKPPVWHKDFYSIPSPFMQEQYFVMVPFDFPVSEQRFYTLTVLNALAGDTMSSRLFRRLREQSGLCYTVYSYNVFFSDCGFWCAYVSSSKKNLARVARELALEFDALKTKGVTADEIFTAQEHLCGEELISSQDMEYRMKRLMRNSAMGFPLRNTEETLELIRNVSEQEVAVELEKLFFHSRRADVVFGPKPAARTLAGLKDCYASFRD